MKYIGEHLLPGQLGQFLVVLSLVASLVACIAYFKSSNASLEPEHESWKKLARIAFLVNAGSVLATFSIIFYIIANHYHEYFYAWNHSDITLNPKYLLSSIWEGQEGAFLLWTLWQSVLGIVLIATAKKWEAPVMTVMSFAQFCLATLIIGVYVFDVKVGSSPFLLTRHQFQDAPIFQGDNYLSLPKIHNGNGLNQLLQNYWMVIHPPVLFMGYASTIVPFAYAIAGMWKKDFGSWTKQALPWSLFSGGIFGLGIMMGAAWAYESLTFGGYWAWDPVENASLVPWLVMVAGIHTQVIYNSTGHSLRATNFFFVMSFLLVLYSTYLTRSGDLQDTSVHAFVDSGLNWQMRIWVLIFAIGSLSLFAARFKKIPHIAKEEEFSSREFWMFIGSLVLFLSSMAIIVPTSFPIFNKLFGTNLVIGEDKEFPYNRIQVFVAVVIGVLTAISQYLKYKNTSKAYFTRKLLWATVISVLVSASISYFGHINYNKYGYGFLAAIHLALFAAVYAVIANAGYIFTGLNGKLKAAGASVAHLGFGLLMVGILISSSKKEILSVNTFNPLNFGPEKPKEGFENLTLFRGIKTDMGSYWATYVKDSVSTKKTVTYFRVDMERKDGKDKFSLYPDLIKNTKGQEGMSNNPDSRHYLHKDIFSYVNHASSVQEGADTAQFRNHVVKTGDTIFYSEGYMILDSVTVNPHDEKHRFTSKDTALMANLTVITKEQQKLTAKPVFYVRNNGAQYMLDTLYSEGLAIGFTRVTDDKHLEISVKESSRLAPFLALKVLQFPFINLVWLGTVLMIIGFVISMIRRIKLL
ncbi:cytochrome c assembly protein [Niastella koreensis]|uniref:Cytochrome c assembly protein n=2 Tax=Niastella koreensis TaxID=354356 RepID=G8TQZ1_NIAKG|nr:cytochrome c biogenesis protein CcsA [Niastella koreensis]AEV97890.1 cytochrome c assembly protein [Niastella koreensis GR20-10]OQP40304.1 cytochrome c assembly protein [Niastella koreensis]